MLSAEPREAQANIIYFRVVDIAPSHADLSARGVTVANAPQMIRRHADGTEEWMAFFSDNKRLPLPIISRRTPV
ncbi:MAG: hypothetical protein MO846_08150 [Candidatus Devosia symbiotica]|nr:hypothetical protein [Candidatus Devosia symbiotica]